MTRAVALVAAALLAASLGVAQETSTSGKASHANHGSTNASTFDRNTSITGCLSEAGLESNSYAVTQVNTDPCADSSTATPSGSGTESLLAADADSGSENTLNKSMAVLTQVSQKEGTQTDESAQNAGESLPQTSTVLPLLGLVGVGSLIAGFFMRR
jgi:hypothetical protein